MDPELSPPAPEAPRPFRRRVLYIPGYDPIPPRRYRELYRREGVAQAAISGYGLDFTARKDRTGFGWGVAGDFEGQRTYTEYEVLLWSDIVQTSMGRSIPATYLQLCRTAWLYIASGAFWRLTQLRRGPVIAALYPVVVLILQLLVAVTLALLAALPAGWAAGQIAAPLGWIGAPVFLLVTVLILRLWQRLDGKLFAYYLMHDYAFTAQNGGAYPPALETRIAQFSIRIAQVLEGDWDEVLIVGHSSGAYLAVSVLSDLFRAGAVPEDGPALSLLTLGHVVPMASFLPRADRLRGDLRYLSARAELSWVDVTAPGDACSFALCDPVAVSGVAPPDQCAPLILSASFTQTLSPARQAALRWRWFRLHFQYLCAFDRPRDYDYFAITAGPQTLGARYRGRPHSPGRMSRPVNTYTSTT